MAAAVFPIECPPISLCAGRLSLGPRPGAERLGSWIEALQDHGVTRCVTLLANGEMERHEFQTLPGLLSGVGITNLRFPIEDYGIPTNDSAFQRLIDGIVQNLRAGDTVHVHCAAGIGRSGMTCVCVLMALGCDRASAIEAVSKARGCAVPETIVQKQFLEGFAPRLR